MNGNDWKGFFRIFRQTVIDLWAGLTGTIFLGIPIWIIFIANAKKAIQWTEILNVLLAY